MVDIHATALMGGVTVIVPEGIPVELDGCVIMGGSTNRTSVDDVLPGAPLVRVHASGMWGGVDVRTKSTDRGSGDRDRDEFDGRALHGHDRHRHDHGSHGSRRDRSPRALDGRESGERLATVRRALDQADGAATAARGRAPAPATSPPTPPTASMPGRGDAPTRPPSPATPPSPSPAGPPTHLPEGTLTIVFTDIVDSTAVVESMGDQRWSAALADHDRALRAVVAERGGTVVKGNGDGYLVVFPSARQAVLAGLTLRDTSDLTLRVGLHTGEVVRQDGDVYGRNVIAASRIAGVAEPGAVLVSALTKDLVDSAGDLSFSVGRTVELKGLAQPWTVHEVAGPAGRATSV